MKTCLGLDLHRGLGTGSWSSQLPPSQSCRQHFWHTDHSQLSWPQSPAWPPGGMQFGCRDWRAGECLVCCSRTIAFQTAQIIWTLKGKRNKKGATFTSCVCLTMPLNPLQAAGRQIFVPMFHHGFAHLMPSLPLLKAFLHCPFYLAQQDRTTCTVPDASVCCTSPLHPCSLGHRARVPLSHLQHTMEPWPVLHSCNAP